MTAGGLRRAPDEFQDVPRMAAKKSVLEHAGVECARWGAQDVSQPKRMAITTARPKLMIVPMSFSVLRA